MASDDDHLIAQRVQPMGSQPTTPPSQTVTRYSSGGGGGSQESLSSLTHNHHHTGTLSTVVLMEPGDHQSTQFQESNLLTADSSSSPASCWGQADIQLSNSCSDYVIARAGADNSSCCPAAAAVAAVEPSRGARSSSEPEQMQLLGIKDGACVDKRWRREPANQNSRLPSEAANQNGRLQSEAANQEASSDRNSLLAPRGQSLKIPPQITRKR